MLSTRLKVAVVELNVASIGALGQHPIGLAFLNGAQQLDVLTRRVAAVARAMRAETDDERNLHVPSASPASANRSARTTVGMMNMNMTLCSDAGSP